jgi:hypothetical protein
MISKGALGTAFIEEMQREQQQIPCGNDRKKSKSNSMLLGAAA